MTTAKLPIHGQALYYLADEEIKFPNLPSIPVNTLFAILNLGKDQYQVATRQVAKNINGNEAQQIATKGSLQADIHEGKKFMTKKKNSKASGILESLLFEAESAIQPAESDPVVVKEVSLDQKVDRYLVRYEREAIPTSAMYDTKMKPNPQAGTSEPLSPLPPPALPPPSQIAEASKKKKGLLESLFFTEAPADALPPPPGGAGEDIFGGGDPGGDAGMGGGEGDAPAPTEPSPPVMDTPKMNMNSYTRAVSRLINNYEALLNPKITILARAKEYIRVNYDEATAKLFEDTMAQVYNITATEPERDQGDAPAAANAIYGGGGGGGGA